MFKFATLATALSLTLTLGACSTTPLPEIPAPGTSQMFKKIGSKEGCDVFQTWDSATERHYRIDCPSSAKNKPATRMARIDTKGMNPNLKCRVTYAVSSQPAYDYTNFNNKWVSATTIKCWGPRIQGGDFAW